MVLDCRDSRQPTIARRLFKRAMTVARGSTMAHVDQSLPLPAFDRPRWSRRRMAGLYTTCSGAQRRPGMIEALCED